MRAPEPADVELYLAFVRENLRQGRAEWEARQRAAGFSASTVSAMVPTVDGEGRVIRQTVQDPHGIVAAYREQQDRVELGIATRHGGGSRAGRKRRRRTYPKGTVWKWADG